MEIRWLNAVIDIPGRDFDVAAAFWQDRAAVTPGDVHPEHTEFVHLLPESGDMHLELQRIDLGPARAHLDLLVDDIGAWTDRAAELGATVAARPGHAVLETPGGVPFCFVPAGDEATKAPLIDTDLPHAVDQICLDVPYEHFDADLDFWAALTGWDANPAQLPEFRSFAQPDHLPLRILVQRLGANDTGRGRAHLDVSCGEHVARLTEQHIAAGATVGEQREWWTALTDPAGMAYCLTSRPPRPGM